VQHVPRAQALKEFISYKRAREDDRVQLRGSSAVRDDFKRVGQQPEEVPQATDD